MRCLPGVRLRRVPPRDARRDGGVDADNGAGIQTQPEPLRELRARDDGDDLPVGTGWRRACLIVAPRSPPRSACSPSSRARRSCSSSTDGSTAGDFSLVLPPNAWWRRRHISGRTDECCDTGQRGVVEAPQSRYRSRAESGFVHRLHRQGRANYLGGSLAPVYGYDPNPPWEYQHGSFCQGAAAVGAIGGSEPCAWAADEVDHGARR